MPDRSNPKDMRLYCGYFIVDPLVSAINPRDRPLSDGLELPPAVAWLLILHHRHAVSASSPTIFPAPALPREQWIRAGRSKHAAGPATRGRCAHACGNPSSPIRTRGCGSSRPTGFERSEPSARWHDLRPATTFCFRRASGRASAQRHRAGCGPEIRAPGRSLAALVD
jgi:hypothetical protein